MTKPIIVRGADFSVSFQITTEPFSEGLLIKSSTAVNPSVVETILPHGLTTGDRVRISGHRKNTVVNGKQTVTVITPFTFSVPVLGVITGEVSGRVSKAVDTTGYTVTAATKTRSGGSVITSAVPTLTTLALLDGEYSVSLTELQTPNVVMDSCSIEITYTDLSSFTKKFAIECDVTND